MTNIERARETIARVRALGVREFCVCAGSRNSPLLAVLGVSDARLFSFVDERSAAFFALGRIKQHGSPVAVVTTSGTAVAELLPATVEAFYSDAPLMLVTADRPARYRGSGAPQCIEQEGIFSSYAHTSPDSWNGKAPLHINVEFDEPLIDAPILDFGLPILDLPPRQSNPKSKIQNPKFERPVLIVGALGEGDRDRVRDFALALNAPVYAEALSGLRDDPALQNLQITAGERMIAAGDFDGVIRVGGVPTLRFWRDLDESRRELPVVSFSRSRFAGLSRGEVHPLDALPEANQVARDEAFFDRDKAIASKIARILDEEPLSEPAMFRALSRDLPASSRIYLGNSLPIREWDLFASREARRFVYEANRGANGIDGQLSTFFGWSAPGADNVAVVGDLTTLYDLNAPWIVPQLDSGTRFRIVVINNGGGKIFSRVPSLRAMDPRVRSKLVENEHTLHFASWAAMWGLKDSVIEKVPDPEATRRAWEKYDALWS
jgi:2-succinyl-5-enolpyruvyl-6-hydroxy-3-cyclohexene-1-carboxylate synthase